MSDVDIEGTAEEQGVTARFPATLAITLVAVGTGLLVWSFMLERDNPQLLEAHPIMANLLSEAIGFCFGVVILSLVIGKLVAYFSATERAAARLSTAFMRHERRLMEEIKRNRAELEEFVRRQDAFRRTTAPEQAQPDPSESG